MEPMKVKRSLLLDWDAIAGIGAAGVVLMLHMARALPEGVMIEVLVILIALLMFRDLRREGREERVVAIVERNYASLARLLEATRTPDAVLVGPSQLRESTQRFVDEANGDITFFNMCPAMFTAPAQFDATVRPLIENPRVASIVFILEERRREAWLKEVEPQIASCLHKEKVLPPVFANLGENIAFILDEHRTDSEPQALISFWGEPFMARTTGRDLPRYMFHVHSRSELPPRLGEIARMHRLLPPV